MSRRDRRDAAAGAVGGLAGGVALAAVMLLADRAARRPPGRPSLRHGIAAEGGHLLVSAALGSSLGMLRRGFGIPAQPAGLLLGLGAYPLLQGVAGPLLGLVRPPWRQRPARIAQRVALHAMFGAVTALVADRLDRVD